MTAQIHTDVDDPLECLRAVHATTRRTKEAKDGQSARLMTDLTKHIPAATQVLASRLIMMTGVAEKMCNLFISNVPGPQEPLYMNGAKLVENYALAPLSDGMGLFIATPSYDGKMIFNVISTREILPDIEFFMQCLRESFSALKAAAKPASQKPGKPKRTRKRKAG